MLQGALEKAGVTQPIDPQLLSKGQPQATLELLSRLYSLSDAAGTPGKGVGGSGARGLGVIDANSGKRKVPAAAAAPSAKRPSRQKPPEAPSTTAEAVAAASAATTAAPSAAESASAESASAATTETPVEVVLRAQLERSEQAVALGKAEEHNLREEVAFYTQKLMLIEEACQGQAPDDAVKAVAQILRADEDELTSIANRK